MFVTTPGLSSEVRRQCEIVGEYLVARTHVQIKVEAILDETGKKKSNLKIKSGDIVTIIPSAQVRVQRRMLMWSAHPDLVDAGFNSFALIQEPGEIGPVPGPFRATKDINLAKLNYVVRFHLVDQIIR